MGTETHENHTDEPAGEPRAPTGEAMVIWVLWATYGSFYFCRTNIAAAVPGLKDSVAAGGLGLEDWQVGWVLGALKVVYGIGQLINGQLAERISPRRLLAFGMLASATLNVLFGFGAGFFFLLFVWGCNGYCQALGWTPCLRVAANWFPVQNRGRVIGILGTSYQVTAAVTYALAGWSAEWFGWRGAFYVPSALLAASAVHMLLFLRESPDSAKANGSALPVRSTAHNDWRTNLWITLSNPRLWILAVSLMLLDACRYGFQDWGLTHLKEVQETGVGLAALKYMVLPLGGIAGAFLAGWATDRYFGGRRAPVICGLLVLLGGLTLLYDVMAQVSMIGTVALLVLIGFAIFGPQVLLVGTAPADLARRGTAAAAAGFVNFMGYMGAFAGDTITGWLKEHHDWSTAVRMWAAWAFAAAAISALLWNVTAARDTRPTNQEAARP